MTAPGSPPPILDVRGLSVVYQSRDGDVPAVQDVDLTLRPGEVVGLAGESGSGKSTLAYGICRLLRPPAVITSGNVIYQGRRTNGQELEILDCTPAELRALRWREIAIVFQSAMNALNPVLRVQEQLADAIDTHTRLKREQKMERINRLIDLVGIPRNRLRSYPHELSGGMRQRVMIAMALVLDPEIIIMDEPTTALDVVVQRDILAEIIQLKDELGFSILFITHDLSVLMSIASHLAVMYAGRLMEVGSAAQIRRRPAHPYTQGLLDSFPSLRGPRRELAWIPGSPPDLRHPSPGCPFIPRCQQAGDSCHEVDMRLLPVSPGHLSACPVTLPAPPPACRQFAPTAGGAQ
jgi:oligopeptide/dipeptide ABC transporter ATP-binding protein